MTVTKFRMTALAPTTKRGFVVGILALLKECRTNIIGAISLGRNQFPKGAKTRFIAPRTGSSNPFPSSSESMQTRSGRARPILGDGIMVFFNDPVPCPNPAERAGQDGNGDARRGGQASCCLASPRLRAWFRHGDRARLCVSSILSDSSRRGPPVCVNRCRDDATSARPDTRALRLVSIRPLDRG